MALILQNFDMALDDPNYEMQILQSLTIKPKDFFMRASLREGITPTVLAQRLAGEHATANGDHGSHGYSKGVPVATDENHELYILYGSNTGTCQALAQKLAGQCAQKGLKAEVKTLDQVTGNVPKKTPTVIITASYEGLPTDDAARFVAWVESLDGKMLDGVRYACFGCGHSDWASTYQRIPKLIDEMLPRFGAERIAERGLSDVSKQDTFGDFEAWASSHLWPALDSRLDSSREASSTVPEVPTIDLEITGQERDAHLQQNVQWANVIDTKVLTAPGEPEKRHIEIQLPSNTTYSTGDYLAVLPLNPKEYVRRVMNYFNLPWDGVIIIKPGSATSLPTGKPVGIFDLLQGYVEISQPATKQDIEILVSLCTDENIKKTLSTHLHPATFASEIIEQRTTILDLITQHKTAITLPFGTYLSLLPPMRTRHYSISSSPLASPHAVTLTYSVLDAPAWYQPEPGNPGTSTAQPQRFLGVAGNYMRSLTAGDKVLVSVRSTNKYFRLPADQERTPILMLANGSGLAPFRGFVQERATLIREGGRRLAPAVLIAGCRREGQDQLYAEEFREWEKLGAVDVRWVFSRGPGSEDRCRYVQDRMLRDHEDVSRLWLDGGRVYICGSKALAQGVGSVARKMILNRAKKEGKEVTEESYETYMRGIRNERFVMDIF